MPSSRSRLIASASIVDGGPLVDPLRLSNGYPFELALTSKVRFELGEDAKHVKKSLARGRRLSIGCSVAFEVPHLALSARTISWRSPMDRASRSMRVTVRISPRKKSEIELRATFSGRFSARTISHPLFSTHRVEARGPGRPSTSARNRCFMALLSSRGISAPSLMAQGEQRRSSPFQHSSGQPQPNCKR